MKFAYDFLTQCAVLLLHCYSLVIYARVLSDDVSSPRILPTPTNLTVAAGDVAKIECKIQNLGGRTVVWRRASEPNPLSIGTMPYTEKHRIRVQHRGQLWTIYIGNVQPADSGVYECQISSKENLRKLFMLRVNDVADTSGTMKPTIHVRGTEVVEVGQPIRLECNTSRIVDSPQALDWFRNGDKIRPNFSRKVTIKSGELRGTGLFTSRLEIEHSQKSDTGMYLCRNAEEDVARIYVDVLNTYSSNVKRGGSLSSEGSGSSKGSGSSPMCSVCQLWALVTVCLSLLLL
ncbi:zwei Ig domain protein zig-8-like isoform X2 [Liolophura sinensis]|uniref:zwei Ig domain protein zig-8-like isoform X2 n=1 Tax=Liolophura sinensis TaxID=3198878 RepID=UPI0031593738